jgi:ketosteroid isomerase-like protein
MAEDVPSPPASNRQLIEGFYDAFGRLEADAMAACYAPDARFSDAVFTDLHGEEIGRMWKMLTSRSTDLEVTASEIEADGDAGSARWIADYTFTQTGRKVHNDVRATFRFSGGLIVEHTDDFDFRTWAKQALGPAAGVPPLTPVFRTLVRRRAAEQLAKSSRR